MKKITAGAPVNVAPFGTQMSWTPEGKDVGIRWGEPRKIRKIVLRFGKGKKAPKPTTLRVEYWQRTWDGKPDPVLSEQNAGGVGWWANDDWTNGVWKTAQTDVNVKGKEFSFTFHPTGISEFEQLSQPGVAYRKTIQLRIVCEQALPPVEDLQIYSDAQWQPIRTRVEWACQSGNTVDWSGRPEGFNALISKVSALSGSETVVNPDGSWESQTSGGIVVEGWMAVDPFSAMYDHPILTIRAQDQPFSVALKEVAAGAMIYVQDYQVLVVRDSDPTRLADYLNLRREWSGRTIYDRVFEQPEQTLAKAWDDMPLKRPLYFVLGCEGGRQNFMVHANGDISLLGRHWIETLPGKDTPRLGWKGDRVNYTFGFPADDQRAWRALEEGYLPLLHTRWLESDVVYEQNLLCDRLDGDLLASAAMEGDDPTVTGMNIRLLNTSSVQPRTVRLAFGCESTGTNTLRQEALVIKGRRVFSTQAGERFCYTLDTGGQGALRPEDGRLVYEAVLNPGESKMLTLWIPFITLDQEDEFQALEARNWEQVRGKVLEYWRRRDLAGAQVLAGDEWLTDFYKAHARHMLINCQREVGADRLMPHVGSFYYGYYTNESCMMTVDLDRRGYHDIAEKAYDALFHYQGTVSLPGNFSSAAGQLYGAGGHESGGYNFHHGWGMWALAQHWRFTRDRTWMERAAPHLIAACQFIIRERKATMMVGPDGNPPIEFGCLPAGSLEDVTDYWHWLSVNAYAVSGFDAVAAALADYGHPQAGWLQQEAKAYHNDVFAAYTQARILAPVVKLRDGTYTPHFPSRLYERGRTFGWIRETLEGAIHLLFTGLVDPCSTEASWIINDFEDNLYISEEYGYAIPTFDQFWFSRGGFSMQANLLLGPWPYLERDEVKHFVRAWLNGFASAFYPETRMCNEHSLPELGYPRGDHFKTSDEANVTWWLRLAFIREQGDDLYLGQGVPRYWLAEGKKIGFKKAPTYFGPMELEYESQLGAGELIARITPPVRNPAKRLFVRFRAPDAATGKPRWTQVTVNGTAWPEFNVDKEWVVLPGNMPGPIEVRVKLTPPAA